MKKSKLTKLAWVFFTLALGTTTVFAQSRGNGNRSYNKQNQVCLERISNLSEDQKAKIEGLNETHQAKMDELRTKRQSTTDAIEKSEIRTTMLENVKAHRDEVKSLLTAEQQKEYDLLHARGNFGNGRGNANFQGRGQGKGQQWAGRNGCGVRSNRGGNFVNGYGNRQYRGCYRN